MAERYAGFWIRLLACLLDAIIFGVPWGILQWALVEELQIMSFDIVLTITFVLLYAWIEGKKGATPGKLACGLRVVDEHGDRIGFANAALRNIGKMLSLILLGIGFLMIAWDSKKQALHDKFAGAYVVWKPA